MTREMGDRTAFRSGGFELGHGSREMLLQAALDFERLGRRALKASLGPGVFETDMRLMLELVRHEQTQANLARVLGMDTGQLTKVVARLRARNLVEERGDTKRRKLLSLSDEGRQVARTVNATRMQVINDYLTTDDNRDVMRLFASARQLTSGVSEVPPSRFVRPAADGDWGILMYIAATTLGSEYFGRFQEVEPYVGELVANYFATRKEDKVFLAAELNGEMAGGIVLLGDRATGIATIKLFAVRYSYLGKGIGHDLLEAAVQAAGKAGFSSLLAYAPRAPDDDNIFKRHEWEFAGHCETALFGSPRQFGTWNVSVP